MRNPKVLLAVVAAVIFGGLWLSTKTDCERMNLRIAKAFKDGKYSQAEFDDLSGFVKNKMDKRSECYANLGSAADFNQALSDVIRAHPDFSKAITLEFVKKKPEPLTAKLYLETSKSMQGYDNEKINDLKNTLGNLLTGFDSDKRLLYTVNGNIAPLGLSYEELIRNGNLFEKPKGGASPKSTDFELIFREIFSDTKTGELSILFSDLIISQNILKTDKIAIIQGVKMMVNNVFNEFSDQFSVLVLKFDSKFDGLYFPYNSKVALQYSGHRPFYAMIIARNETMHSFLSQERFKSTVNWADYENFAGYEYFTKLSQPAPANYSVVIDKQQRIGKYSQDRKEMSKGPVNIHALQDVATTDQGLEIVVDVDFSSLFLADSYLLNKSNYRVDKDFGIKNITALLTNQGFTHRIKLSYQKNEFVKDQHLFFELIKPSSLQPWVESSDSEDDTDLTDPMFSSRTFGIKGVLTGIGQAYQTPNKTYYKFSLNLKK